MKENKRIITFTDIIILIVIILIFSMIIIQYYKPVKAIIHNGSKSGSNFERYANFSGLELEYTSLNISPRPNNRSATGVVLLNYHGVFAANTGFVDAGGISYDRFKDHMFALKKLGYKTINMEDLYLFLKGDKQLPEKSIMLTFDDGIKDSYYNVDPILKLLDYNAVMFAITYQSIEKNNSKYYLNKDELHQMQDSGRWDIESHTYNAHGKVLIDEKGAIGPYLTNKLWIINESRLETDQEYAYRIQSDIQTSKEQLEQEFNKTILGLALPFGEFGQRQTNYVGSEQIILSVGRRLFPMIFYQFKPAINKDFRANFKDPKKDFFLVMRLPADYISTDNLLREVEAAQPLDLPYIEKFDNPRRWIFTRNSKDSNSENGLNITNKDNISGGTAYLDGSYFWKDYMYSSIIEKNGSDKILLLSRFQDSENYVACRYANKSISIVNVRNGIPIDIDKVSLTETFTGLDLQSHIKLSISVIEKNVECYINDNLTIGQSISDIPPNGGIGIKIEDLPINKSVTFTSIIVEYPNYGG